MSATQESVADRADRTAQTAAVLPVAVAALVVSVTQLVWLGVSWRTVLAVPLLIGAAWARWRSAEPAAPPAPGDDRAAASGLALGWLLTCAVLALAGLGLVAAEALAGS